MRYSTETKYRKKDMSFCHLQENLVINMEKKFMDTSTKTGIYAAKTASKRVVQKTAEAIKLLQPIKQRKQKKITFHQNKGSK